MFELRRRVASSHLQPCAHVAVWRRSASRLRAIANAADVPEPSEPLQDLHEHLRDKADRMGAGFATGNQGRQEGQHFRRLGLRRVIHCSEQRN